MCCLYHPPNEDHDATIDYITTTILQLTPKHPSAKYLLAGDFNRLPVENLCEQFGLSDLVTFNTRESAKLDLMLTDISEYQPAVKLAPLAHNDHCCILVKGQMFKNNSYVRINKRLATPKRKNSFLAELAATDWGNVLHSPSVHTKVAQLHKTVNELLNKHCPAKTFKVRSDRPQWMTSSILKLIRAREEAHSKGCASYKFLRSLVQKAIRSSKRKFVNEQLNNQKDTKVWWDTVKLLTKPPHPTNDENRRTVINGEPLLNDQLADKLNAYYKEVGGEPVPPPQSSSD